MARILVIDDHVFIRHLVRTVLEGEGHEVSEAANGAEGLQGYAAAPADLVITDMQMPVMDGLQVLAALRRGWPAAGVIAMSGDPSALTQAQQFTPYTVAKPFAPQCLLATVQTLVAASAPLSDGSPLDQGTRGALSPRPDPPARPDAHGSGT